MKNFLYCLSSGAPDQNEVEHEGTLNAQEVKEAL